MKTEMTNKERLALAKPYKKMFETVLVNEEGYVYDEQLYLLAFYKSTFGDQFKGRAVVSPEPIPSKKVERHVFQKLLTYGIAVSQAKTIGKSRAKFDMTPFNEVYRYVKEIVLADVLEGEQAERYRRLMKAMERHLLAQKKIVQLYVDILTFNSDVMLRGYFRDDELEQMVDYIMEFDYYLYVQKVTIVRHLEDFDAMYEEWRSSEVKPFSKFAKKDSLKAVTSDVVRKRYKEAIEHFEEGEDLSHLSKEQFIVKKRDAFKRQVEELVNDSFRSLRSSAK